MKLVNPEQVIVNESNLNPFSSRIRYPDFRFHCPHCGSLEVLVSFQSTNTPLKGRCLDCKKNWN